MSSSLWLCVLFEAGGGWWRVELSFLFGGSREGEQSFSHRTVDMAVSNNITRVSHIYPTRNSSIYALYIVCKWICIHVLYIFILFCTFGNQWENTSIKIAHIIMAILLCLTCPTNKHTHTHTSCTSASIDSRLVCTLHISLSISYHIMFFTLFFLQKMFFFFCPLQTSFKAGLRRPTHFAFAFNNNKNRNRK